MSRSASRPDHHLLVVDLAAVRFSRQRGVTTARLADGTVLAVCDTGDVPPAEAAATTLRRALEVFSQARFTSDGELVTCRLALYNPFSAQVETATAVFTGGVVGLPAGGLVVEADGAGFRLDGQRFVAETVGELTVTLTRALAAHT